MNFDFSTVLVIAVAISGVIWLADVLVFKPKRIKGAESLKVLGGDELAITNQIKEPVMVEYARSFFPVILVVLILRSFIVEPFRIPSGSMMPTLLSGDFILVNKFDYGIRLPAINTKIFDLGNPQRGDIVVFRYPVNPSLDYIKRVVGLPGDTVTYRGKRIYINGEPVILTSLGEYVGVGEAAHMSGISHRYKEKLGDVEHDILTVGAKSANTWSGIVPEGEYFVMGDNRDNSSDGRVWGFVPDENLVGRAFMIWMNWDSELSRVSFERIGTIIE